jgi:hypothetical protein
MRYPNLRYGNPQEMAYYSQGIPLSDLARRLRRSERSVHDWLSGRSKVPWWVPELMRLQAWERADRLRQMNMTPMIKKLGLRTAEIIPLHPQAESIEPIKAYK